MVRMRLCSTVEECFPDATGFLDPSASGASKCGRHAMDLARRSTCNNDSSYEVPPIVVAVLLS